MENNTPPKIIFLDIDGVLNNHIDADTHRSENKIGKRERFFYSKRCVALLNDLIKHTGAKVVVSSTWRLGETLESMSDVLKHIGVECDMIGITEKQNHYYVFRGNEILKWIKDNKDIIKQDYIEYRNYVILDDDNDILLWQKDNYVNIDPYSGLTPRNIYKAKSILNNSICEDAMMEFSIN